MRNVIKKALKLLSFSCKITKIAQRPGAPPQDPRPQSLHFYIFSDYVRSVTRLSCTSFFSTGPKSDKFCAKKNNNFWFKPLSKILVACLVAFTVVERFFRQLWATEETSYIRNAAGLIDFLDMNAEFLKLRVPEAVQDQKINFYMQKFSLF